MKLVITGINGFVGQTLYKHLSRQYEVVGIYNSGDSLFPNSFKIDLTSESETQDFFNTLTNVDTIIHLASRMASANNLHDISIIKDNVSMARNVALGAKQVSSKHLINLSSSSVYPNVNGIFDENSIIDPSMNSDCIYGLSKYNTEVLFNYLLSGVGITTTHLRSSIIYGSGMNEAHLLPVLKKELENTNSITLFGNGERLINMIHVDKLAEYVSFFVQHPEKGIINVSEECLTLLELGEKIIGTKDSDRKKITLKPEGNRSQFRLNIKKLQNLISNKHV